MISAKVVADSKNQFGDRLTTMLVTMPRYILAEFNTHRMFSRNSASSRAIPFARLVESVQTNPFIPIAWMKDHKGMQGTEYFTNETVGKQDQYVVGLAEVEWKSALSSVIESAVVLNKLGVTKQMANRLLEAHMYHTVLVSATEWENFFALRCPQYVVNEGREGETFYRSKEDLLSSLREFPRVQEAARKRTIIQWLESNRGQADIHMMATAEAMWCAYNKSVPKELEAGQWHIAFGEQIEEKLDKEKNTLLYPSDEDADEMYNDNSYVNGIAIKISTAMAARTSYTVFGEDGKELTSEKLIGIHDKLYSSVPLHASPFEHCARVMSEDEYLSHIRGVRDKSYHVSSIAPNDNTCGWSGNFRGFIQYRKMVPNENIVK